MNDRPDVDSLVSSLRTDSDSARKFAVFKLQALLGDRDFALEFVQSDGPFALRCAVVETSGNTLAYALGSLNKLLELGLGWECVDEGVVEKAVSLSINHPLINTVRNALTLLVLVVSRQPPSSEDADDEEETRLLPLGFRALSPAIESYPTFLESLVQRLNASDHTLCANALQLVNALMRDAVTYGGEHEWPRFVKRLQDLGVIGGVGMLMRGDAAADAGSPLAAAILEFQDLTKVLLRKWREVRVNVELGEHKKALKTVHLLSKPEPYQPPQLEGEAEGRRRHHPEKWRRLGFETESPAWEFDETGYLGMMDLVDFAKRDEDAYQKVLLEQSVQTPEARCPVARASLSVTLILYEHFEIDEAAWGADGPVDRKALQARVMDARERGTVDRLYRPLLLQWGRLHSAALHAFYRLWKASGAELDDFYKVEEVVRIVVERLVGSANRKTEVGRIEDDLRGVSLETARKWQMEGLDEVYEDAWGPHLVQVREQLRHESLQFMKEQRVRCLLEGSWFPSSPDAGSSAGGWRYVRLSSNRKHLHHRVFPAQLPDDPDLSELTGKIDLSTVTSVNSDASPAAHHQTPLPTTSHSSTSTLKDTALPPAPKITLLGSTKTSTQPTYKLTPTSPPATPLTAGPPEPHEHPLLTLQPASHPQASEWLDGLLLLLDQQPITKDTTRLVEMLEDWGVRLRMLNLRWEDVDWEELEGRVMGVEQTLEGKGRDVPGREGLEGEGFWYALPAH